MCLGSEVSFRGWVGASGFFFLGEKSEGWKRRRWTKGSVFWQRSVWCNVKLGRRAEEQKKQQLWKDEEREKVRKGEQARIGKSPLSTKANCGKINWVFFWYKEVFSRFFFPGRVDVFSPRIQAKKTDAARGVQGDVIHIRYELVWGDTPGSKLSWEHGLKFVPPSEGMCLWGSHNVRAFVLWMTRVSWRSLLICFVYILSPFVALSKMEGCGILEEKSIAWN